MGKTVLTGNSESLSETYASREVTVGQIKLGGQNPVRIQSMTNTDTNDIHASLLQCMEIISAGGELVRLTTQGKREVESIAAIRKLLREKGINTPVVADIHFKPLLAETAASLVDKIRINPGNYLKGSPEDADEMNLAQRQLGTLLALCEKHGTAIRIGVNHGSLSERIMMKYGNTPLGMAESALEFIRICASLNFHQLIVSLKSSNTKVMIEAVRLLVRKMQEEKLNYPLHLGVTEAGDDLYGRIKSIVGIAPLLLEGMGDTIRVSLTENPVNEIPVALQITRLFKKPAKLPYHPFRSLAWDPFSYRRRQSTLVSGIGNGAPPLIISNYADKGNGDLNPAQISPFCVGADEYKWEAGVAPADDKIVLFEHKNETIQEMKHRISEYCKTEQISPIIYKRIFEETNLRDFQYLLSGELGFLLIEGIIDAVWMENKNFPDSTIYELLLMIFQASGSRISQTEYIACPSCGRTHFNIESRLSEIKQATSHLKHLKIGIMGCIVNGPGEMADADYGYVGAGKGRISIYKGREVVYKNIPEAQALEGMLAVIKENGDWIDP